MKTSRYIRKNILVSRVYDFLYYYPGQSSTNYFWNFGFLAMICLGIQMVTGIVLAMHYVANVELAFIVVEHIMRDVNSGFLVRYIHANGASMFFIIIYIHISRGLYYSSYVKPRENLWGTGVIILLIMILTSFLGYVLPWGQMSFWAATVITNLCSAIPVIGIEIVFWLWGSFSVDNSTLNRFFSFHYLMPFMLAALVAVHLIYLHEKGSNNVLGIEYNGDSIAFAPYFMIKDILGFVVFQMFIIFFVFFVPNYLGHPDNYIEANPIVTPAHIVPEWYFLPFYALLRAIPDKMGGVIVLLCAILVLLVISYYIKGDIKGGLIRPIYRTFFWFFLLNGIVLGWLGGNGVDYPYYNVGQFVTVIYFFYFLVIIPIITQVEFFLYKLRIN